MAAYKSSVQTAYMAAFESLRSANYYINFNCGLRVEGENDNSSPLNISNSELMSLSSSDKILRVIDDMIKGLKNDETTEWNKRISAVTFMTFNYYINKNCNPIESGVKFGDAPDATTAKTLLITRRLEEFMNEYMNSVNRIQKLYIKYKVDVNEGYVDKAEFSKLALQYAKGRAEILSKTYKKIFRAIKDAFLLGNEICICNGPAKIDEQLLVSN